MNKDKAIEVVDSKETKVNLTMEMVDLTILYKTRENMNGKVKIKARPSGKVVITIKVLLVPIEEEVILTLEMDFMVNFIDVVVKVIDIFNAEVMVRMLVEML